MAQLRLIELICDDCGYTTLVEFETGIKVDGVPEEAHDEGWRQDNGKDFCKVCSQP